LGSKYVRRDGEFAGRIAYHVIYMEKVLGIQDGMKDNYFGGYNHLDRGDG
jgi:hypothetical protein